MIISNTQKKSIKIFLIMIEKNIFLCDKPTTTTDLYLRFQRNQINYTLHDPVQNCKIQGL